MDGNVSGFGLCEDDVVNEKLTKWAIFLMFLKRFYQWERLIKEQIVEQIRALR